MFGEFFDFLADLRYHPWISILFDSIKAATIFSTASLFAGTQMVSIALTPKEFKKTIDYTKL